MFRENGLNTRSSRGEGKKEPKYTMTTVHITTIFLGSSGVQIGCYFNKHIMYCDGVHVYCAPSPYPMSFGFSRGGGGMYVFLDLRTERKTYSDLNNVNSWKLIFEGKGREAMWKISDFISWNKLWRFVNCKGSLQLKI